LHRQPDSCPARRIPTAMVVRPTPWRALNTPDVQGHAPPPSAGVDSSARMDAHRRDGPVAMRRRRRLSSGAGTGSSLGPRARSPSIRPPFPRSRGLLMAVEMSSLTGGGGGKSQPLVRAGNARLVRTLLFRDRSSTPALPLIASARHHRQLGDGRQVAFRPRTTPHRSNRRRILRHATRAPARGVRAANDPVGWPPRGSIPLPLGGLDGARPEIVL
jgi:hypothetical protein